VDDLIIMQYPAQQWRERKDKKQRNHTRIQNLCLITSFTKVQGR